MACGQACLYAPQSFGMRAQHQHSLVGQQRDQVILKRHQSIGKTLKAVLVTLRVQEMFCEVVSQYHAESHRQV
jgi:hypothetical protein